MTRVFEQLVEHAGRVLGHALTIRSSTSPKQKTKFKKLDVFSVVLLFLQRKSLQNINISDETYDAIARHLIEFKRGRQQASPPPVERSSTTISKGVQR